LYPFLPIDGLTPDVRMRLAAIAAEFEPFDVVFRRVRRWPGAIWLEPEPDEPFIAMTAAVTARWPAHPPYGGLHAEVTPHLTITESDVAPLEAIASAAATALPLAARATRLDLWRQDETGRWHPHWRMTLGRPRRSRLPAVRP
jgi:hypothetical protein